MILDINASIVPFEGFGEIKLYSTRDELWELFFHLKNNKLFRITTLDNYQGKLFEKVGVGTTEKELLELEPSFVYDDFEEVWESEKGVFIETDAETHIVRWISVYIKELDDEDFGEAN